MNDINRYLEVTKSLNYQKVLKHCKSCNRLTVKKIVPNEKDYDARCTRVRGSGLWFCCNNNRNFSTWSEVIFRHCKEDNLRNKE